MTGDSRSAYRDLVVWQKSMEFANSVIDLTEILETERKHYRLVEQLEAAATSIPMNIADIVPERSRRVKGRGKAGFPEKSSNIFCSSRAALYMKP
jgi:hypothetical protein